MVLILGIGLRLAFLDRNSLWYDEAFTFGIHSSLAVDARGYVFLEGQGPLYYYALDLWSYFFNGDSVFSLRLFSALMNILTILVLYLAGNLFFSPRAALWSALILSISPLHLWYSQEIRGYTLVTLLTLLSITCFILALEKEKKTYWAAFIFFSLLSLLISYHTSLILLGMFVSPMVIKKLRANWKNFFISCTIIAVCFSPCAIIITLSQFKIFTSKLNWIVKPPPLAILFTFFEFNLGYSSINLLYFISSLIIAYLLITGFWKKELSDEKQLRLKLLVLIVSFSAILTFIISLAVPIYITRYLLPLSVLYYLILGVAIENCQHKFKKIAVFILIVITGISCLYYYQNNFQHHLGSYTKYPFHHGVHRKSSDIEEIMEIFNRNAKEGDVLAVSHQSLYPVIFCYSKHYLKEGLLKRQITYLGRNRDIVKPVSIPIFMFTTQKYAREDKYLANVVKVIQNRLPKKFDVLYPDRGDLENINFKKLWLLVSSWDGSGDNYDKCSLETKKWCDSNLENILKERVGNIGILLYKNSRKL